MSVWNWKVSNKAGQKVNYQKELDKLILELKKEEKVPRLLLHSCCAPCSSYVLEYLSQYFEVTVFIIIRIYIQKVNIRRGCWNSKN